MKRMVNALIVLSLLAWPVCAQNLITNGSFEDQTPYAWSPLNGTMGTDVDVELTEVANGFRSFKITKSAATTAAVGWLSDDNANKLWNNAGSGTFSVTADIKTVGANTSPANDDAKIGVEFVFNNASGTELAFAQVWADQSTASVDWATYATTVSLSEAPEQVFVKLLMGKDATGTAYFDNVDCNTSDSWTMGVFNGGAEDVDGFMDWYGGNGNYTTVTDEDAHTGDYSIIMVQPDTMSNLDGELVYYSQPYAVEAGEWYKLSFWCKTVDVIDSSDWEAAQFPTNEYVQGWINLCYFWHGDADIEHTWSNLPEGDKFLYIEQRDASTGWTQYSAGEQAPTEATGISMRARFNTFTTGTAYWDDFAIEKMVVVPSSVDPEDPSGRNTIPTEYSLSQNYPNPFNPTTSIKFACPQTGMVRLEVYNMLGQKVRTLADGVYAQGTHQITWNTMNDSGNPVASGVYFYSLVTNDSRITKKMLLVR